MSERNERLADSILTVKLLSKTLPRFSQGVVGMHVATCA